MSVCPHCAGTGRSNGVKQLPEYNGKRLTLHEGLILAWLLENEGRVVGKDSMMAAVYGHLIDPPRVRTLDVHLMRLRRKLAGSDVSIETIWAQGYRLRRTGSGRVTA